MKDKFLIIISYGYKSFISKGPVRVLSELVTQNLKTSGRIPEASGGFMGGELGSIGEIRVDQLGEITLGQLAKSYNIINREDIEVARLIESRLHEEDIPASKVKF